MSLDRYNRDERPRDEYDPDVVAEMEARFDELHEVTVLARLDAPLVVEPCDYCGVDCRPYHVATVRVCRHCLADAEADHLPRSA